MNGHISKHGIVADKGRRKSNERTDYFTVADILGRKNRHDTRDLLHSRFFVTIYAVFVALAAMTAFNSNDKDVKAAKIIVCTALILDMLGAFLPTEKEIYAMYAAEHITPANIKATGEFADKAVDKLIEKIAKASKAIKE